MMERGIPFKIVVEASEFHFNIFENEYRSLMHLINDQLYLEDFGQCGGMGRCGTCVVSSQKEVGVYNRNEYATLQRHQLHLETNKRLACQIFIDRKINGGVFII
jgi:2Fe-2S ferredoxin